MSVGSKANVICTKDTTLAAKTVRGLLERREDGVIGLHSLHWSLAGVGVLLATIPFLLQRRDLVPRTIQPETLQGGKLPSLYSASTIHLAVDMYAGGCSGMECAAHESLTLLRVRVQVEWTTCVMPLLSTGRMCSTLMQFPSSCRRASNLRPENLI